MADQARKLEVDLIETDQAETDLRQLSMARQTGIHHFNGADVEEVIYVNGTLIEFRVIGPNPRTFKVDLRQVAQRALDQIGEQLGVSAPSEAGPL